MNKAIIALLGGAAMVSALAAGYTFSQGSSKYGWLFASVAALAAMLMIKAMYGSAQKKKAAKAYTGPPAINPAFYGELNRLIDEGKDISAYLRGCGAPENMVKSINIGGATRWYYHKEGLAYNEFCADVPQDEAPVEHPYIKEQRTEWKSASTNTLFVKVDLYRVLWDWGEAHPEHRRYANSMRMALKGGYQPADDSGDNSFLNKSINTVRADRKAATKKPKKQKQKKDDPLLR